MNFKASALKNRKEKSCTKIELDNKKKRIQKMQLDFFFFYLYLKESSNINFEKFYSF